MLNVVRTEYIRTKRKLYDKYVMTIVIDYMRAPLKKNTRGETWIFFVDQVVEYCEN